MSGINQRARKILNAIVHEYLATGDAVGSRTVTRRHGIDLSPATVRNVMSDLEEAGLLTQPHTSAGRVPTAVGLRFFVDSLLKVRSLSQKEREELEHRYSIGGADIDTALRDAGRVLSELSAHTVVLVTPRPDADVLDHVEFVRLRELQLLAVLVTKSGQVQNKIVDLQQPIAPEELKAVPYGDRKKRVIEAINALGVRNADEEPLPGHPEFGRTVGAWCAERHVDAPHATLWRVLESTPEPCAETRMLIEAVRAKKLPADPWLAELAIRLGGKR